MTLAVAEAGNKQTGQMFVVAASIIARSHDGLIDVAVEILIFSQTAKIFNLSSQLPSW